MAEQVKGKAVSNRNNKEFIIRFIRGIKNVPGNLIRGYMPRWLYNYIHPIKHFVQPGTGNVVTIVSNRFSGNVQSMTIVYHVGEDRNFLFLPVRSGMKAVENVINLIELGEFDAARDACVFYRNGERGI